MNRQRVLNIIREPLRMEHEKDLPLIKELIEEFPYFSAPYVLLTKLLSEQKSIYFDKYLKLSAGYIGDREVLYNFIHTPLSIADNVSETAVSNKQTGSFQEEIIYKPADNESIAGLAHINVPEKIVALESHQPTLPEEQDEFEEQVILNDAAAETVINVAETVNVAEPDTQAVQNEKIVSGSSISEERSGADTESLVKEEYKTGADGVGEETKATENEIITESEAVTEDNAVDINEAVAETNKEAEGILNIENNAETQAEHKGQAFQQIAGEENNIPAEEENIEELQPGTLELLETEGKPAEEDQAKQNIDEIGEQFVAEDAEVCQDKKSSSVRKESDLLDLPPLAAYDYFAFQEKFKPVKAPLQDPVTIPEPEATIVEPVQHNGFKVETDNKTQSGKTPLKFGDWLKSLSQQDANTVSAETAEVAVKEPANIVPIDLLKPEPKPVRKPKPNEVDNIISKFIQAEPRIKPKPAKFFTPQDVAERSAEEDTTLVTETLANIYLKQGLNEKAVEIFQQLMRKYPQKSNYFAVKINEINTKP